MKRGLNFDKHKNTTQSATQGARQNKKQHDTEYRYDMFPTYHINQRCEASGWLASTISTLPARATSSFVDRFDVDVAVAKDDDDNLVPNELFGNKIVSTSGEASTVNIV